MTSDNDCREGRRGSSRVTKPEQGPKDVLCPERLQRNDTKGFRAAYLTRERYKRRGFHRFRLVVCFATAREFSRLGVIVTVWRSSG